jgi:hypothetical protein
MLGLQLSNSPVLNWPLLIFSANSIRLMVTAALSNRLNPSIGRTRCLTRRWSCSIEVVQVLARSDSHSCGKFAGLLHFPHRAMRCRISVQRDFRRLTRVLHRMPEKGLGRIHIPISAQEEANSVPGLFMRRFVRPNILKQAKVLKPNTYSSLRDVVWRGKVASKHEMVLLVDPLVIDI